VLPSFSDETARLYQQARMAHWDAVARRRDHWQGAGRWYHRRLEEIYRFLVPPGRRVLEIGCGRGDLLAALQPEYGVGVDFSAEMIRRARQRHPSLEFVQADAHALPELSGPFDVVIFSDTINDLWDVQQALEQVRPFCTPHTRLILNFYNTLWQGALKLAQRLGLANPLLPQNWLTPQDVENLLRLAGFEVIRRWQEVLWPLPLGGVFNRVLIRLWPFYHLGLAHFLIARPAPTPVAEAPTVTVVVPARNEAGNIRPLLERLPRMGKETEVIFVEGHSRDDTYGVIEREIAAHPDLPARLFRQQGTGKADAVRLGFAHARGDVLMILDADLTVPPEVLPRFYQALVSGKGEFINGVRLVYPMEGQAMRFLNYVGNKFFSLIFSWLLGQPVKDTLCGTKVLWWADYEKIVATRADFGDFDPFGDFDLLFGAARHHLKILDLPVRYRERTYGKTNISRWRHGWLLLRMSLFGARRLKFR
jgi:SAM-dependent methyltransferase